MSYAGIVKGGVVVLPSGVQLPDGTQVEVTVLNATATPRPAGTAHMALAEFVGAFEGLPADLARNHDRYLHGPRQTHNGQQPKR